MKEKVKFGEIVFIPDLHELAMVCGIENLFEDGIPICLLRMVEVDKKTGVKIVTMTRRPLDKIEEAPRELLQEASVLFYQSPAEKIYMFAGLRMNKNKTYYDNIGDPVTVENHAQRRAGYYEAMAEIQYFIEKLMSELKTSGCAENWYVARDDDGTLTLFDTPPEKIEVVKGHVWWSRTGNHRITLLPASLPDLKEQGCSQCRVTVELIKEQGYGSEAAH